MGRIMAFSGVAAAFKNQWERCVYPLKEGVTMSLTTGSTKYRTACVGSRPAYYKVALDPDFMDRWTRIPCSPKVK